MLHAFGRMSEEEKMYVPEMEFPKIYLEARVCRLIYVAVVALSIAMGSILPLCLSGWRIYMVLGSGPLRPHPARWACRKRSRSSS